MVIILNACRGLIGIYCRGEENDYESHVKYNKNK